MKVTGGIRLSSLVLAALALGTDAAAQTPVQSFAALQPTLKVGQSVFVTDDKGIVTTGRVVSIVGNQLEIDGIQREPRRSFRARLLHPEGPSARKRYLFTEDSVRRIENDDGAWNGALIGVGVGLLLTVWEVSTPQSDEGTLGTSLVIFPALGGPLGGAIDKMIHRSLYVSARGKSASFAPFLGRGRAGIAATVRF